MNFLFSSERMGLKLGMVLFCAAVLYGLALSPDILGFYHDDGVYAVTAKALVEGKGYRIISLPGEPVQMTYPIFYPLVLSVVWRIFPDFPANILDLKVPSIIFTLLFLWVTYRYLVRRNYASPRMALAIVIMTAFNPWMVWTATMAMSEALYCLVSVLSLWAVELFVSGTRDYRRFKYLPLAGIAIAVSLMTRSIGFSILLSTFIYLFLDKRRGPKDRRLQGAAVNPQSTLADLQSAKENLQSGIRNPQSPDRRSRKISLFRKGFALATQLELAVLVFLSPWLVWTVLQYLHQAHVEIYQYRPAFYSSYASSTISLWKDFGMVFFFKSFLLNVYSSFWGAIPNLILPGIDVGRVKHLYFMKDYFWYLIVVVSGFLLSLLVITPLIRDIIKRKFSLVTIYLLFALVVILLWPVQPDRFLIPVFPFVFLHFLKGVFIFTERFKGFYKGFLPMSPGMLGFVLLFLVIVNCSLAIAQDGANIMNARKSDEWAEKKKIFQWIKENTKHDDILVSSISPMLYLYTGRKTIPPVIGMDLNDISELPNAVVIENFRNLLSFKNGKNLYLVKLSYFYPAVCEQMIDRLAIKYPDRITLVYTGKSMKYAIYKMK